VFYRTKFRITSQVGLTDVLQLLGDGPVVWPPGLTEPGSQNIQGSIKISVSSGLRQPY
jgi:hypothetical protein